MKRDLTALREAVASGHVKARALFDESAALAHDPVNRHTFIRLFEAQGRSAADAIDALRAAGAPVPPLGGLAVSIKDLFDVYGAAATGASRVLTVRDATDCPAVARLRAAGAALMGHTNLTEFAFSGVGINPHHGTPANPVTGAADGTPRIPGGSTSGGAVSVATGAAHAALGSDTGGSIRIPAALQGLVGFKNTARLTPAEGAIPLSTTLDTTCAITRSMRDAVLLHEMLAARRVVLAGRALAQCTFGVPQTVMLDALEPPVARAFERTLSILSRAGARIETLALPQIGRLKEINATGGFSAAESWSWHRRTLASRGSQYDPRVASRIRRGESMSAADYIELLQARRAWIAEMAAPLAQVDAMLSPTVPMVAPALAPLIESDDAFFATNALLLRNPSVINMLDGCATSLPCHADGELPVGLMAWSGALRDDDVLDVSLAIEAALNADPGMRS